MGIFVNLVFVLIIFVCGGFYFLGRKVYINIYGILWGYICKIEYVFGCWIYLEMFYLDYFID